MIAERFPEILALPDEEKLQLASELWSTVTGSCSAGEDPELVALLDARWAEYQAHPERASHWHEVKGRLQSLRK